MSARSLTITGADEHDDVCILKSIIVGFLTTLLSKGKMPAYLNPLTITVVVIEVVNGN